VPDEVAAYIISVVRRTRVDERLELGASSRAAIHLLSASKAQARLGGRDEIALEDVHDVAPYVLRHRLVPRQGASVDDALRDALDK
jgi:MoxR-like ATPase